MLADRSDAIDEPSRLATLRASNLLDTPAEAAFDRLSRLATRILGVPVALISLVDKDRQFFKSCVGLPEPWASWRETPLTHSFCQHVVASSAPLIINDTREDPRYRHNLAVRDLAVVAYLGVPLAASNGHVLGSFCVIDPRPRDWTRQQVQILEELAASVMTEIELRGEIARSERADRILRREQERLSAIVAIQNEIAAAELDPAITMKLVVERTQELTGASGAAIELVEGDEMVYHVASGAAAPYRGLRLKVTASLSGRCLQTDESLQCDDAETDPRVDLEACRKVGVRSMILVPLHHRRSVAGVLKVLSPEAYAFSLSDRDTLEPVRKVQWVIQPEYGTLRIPQRLDRCPVGGDRTVDPPCQTRGPASPDQHAGRAQRH